MQRTPLFALHQKLGARMVTFAGYEMPLQYQGILAEHLHARRAAVLFDVSHMGQATLDGDAIAPFERLVVADVKGITAGRVRYTLLTNEQGGIIDDLMITHGGYYLSLVVNAARKAIDYAHIRSHLGAEALQAHDDRALLALQGPLAATVLGRLASPARLMLFMTSETLTIGDVKCTVSRSGYTGEDGYEISVPAEAAEDVAELILNEPEVKPAGLGARDTLRLEAGLCLYGNDIDETTTPIEAGLAWTISKRRRIEGGFLGDAVIQRQMVDRPRRKRVGIRLNGKAPARAGTTIADGDGRPIGHVTSGSFAPSLGVPIAMGYVDSAAAAVETKIKLIVRDRPLGGVIVEMPFVPRRYNK